MGTSGAFGGSQTASWKDVAEYLAGPEQDGRNDGLSTDTDGTLDIGDQPDEESLTDGDESPGSALADLVAKALQADDPTLRPMNAPVSRPGDSGLSYGKLVGNPRRTGTTRAVTGGGRRQIAASVGKAGRAVGAGHALASRDAASLADYGLDLSALDGLSKIDQIFAIMGAVEVGNAGPDDVALRGALYDVLDRILTDDQASRPIETLRELITEYAVQLFTVELDALIQNGQLDLERRSETIRELSDVIRFDASRLNVEGASLTTPEQFAHASQQLMRATLAIVRQGDVR
jgi:hypothetical protein